VAEVSGIVARSAIPMATANSPWPRKKGTTKRTKRTTEEDRCKSFSYAAKVPFAPIASSCFSWFAALHYSRMPLYGNYGSVVVFAFLEWERQIHEPVPTPVTPVCLFTGVTGVHRDCSVFAASRPSCGPWLKGQANLQGSAPGAIRCPSRIFGPAPRTAARTPLPCPCL
jgi:hypothetical protein